MTRRAPPEAEAIKLVCMAHAVLQRAAAAICETVPTGLCSGVKDAAADVARSRARARDLLVLLEKRGLELRPCGGFWRDLMRACEALDLDESFAHRCREQYHAALQAVVKEHPS